MGQIIIDLPVRVKRHYKIDDVESANELLATLQNTARRVEDDSEKLTAEDLADIRAAKRAREKGEFISLEELKTELGIRTTKLSLRRILPNNCAALTKNGN